LPSANDVGHRPMMTLTLMMCGFATFWGKYRIIASETSNIIFAKQMHHIAVGDASLKNGIVCDMI